MRESDEEVTAMHRGVMRVWVHYDAAIREAVIYEIEPPASFRRGRDIGPIELDGDLVKEYRSAKEAWQNVHLRFVAAVWDAQGQSGLAPE